MQQKVLVSFFYQMTTFETFESSKWLAHLGPPIDLGCGPVQIGTEAKAQEVIVKMSQASLGSQLLRLMPTIIIYYMCLCGTFCC